MNPHLFQALLWFGMAAARIVGQALLQEVPMPLAAAIGYLPRPAVDRLELYGMRRRCVDLAA